MRDKTQKFLLATLLDGSQVVSEFSALGGSGQGYAGQVFSLRKPFNAWRVVGGTHPQSGEATLVRTREMFNGTQIKSIAQVKPLAGMEETHGYAPENFEPVQEIQKGEYGMYVAPEEGAPEGAVPGAAYPIHRDPQSLQRYVVLRVAQGSEGAEGYVPEVRHLIDGAAAGVGASRREDSGDDSENDDDFNW